MSILALWAIYSVYVIGMVIILERHRLDNYFWLQFDKMREADYTELDGQV